MGLEVYVDYMALNIGDINSVSFAKSHYGKALKLAYGYVVAASDYFNSDMSIYELRIFKKCGGMTPGQYREKFRK